MSKIDGYIACNRFSLGALDDELARASADARGWLKAQLQNPVIPDSVKADQGGRAALHERMKKMGGAKKAAADDVPPALPTEKPSEDLKKGNGAVRKVYVAETTARMIAHTQSTQGFIERQIMFWSNHLAVSIQKPILASLVNRYEVEAIRPHVGGYFKDMVLASARHPAMLLYLDNARSIGTNSKLGQRRSKGLNENYAREVMELHTLGVGSGYTQDDVIALAKILTGWSIDQETISFKFRDAVHEPGVKTLLGKTFAESGEQEGIDAITMLCQSPATAKHVANKIALHFLSDVPSQKSINALADSFMRSNGHLPTVMETLINLEEAWMEPLTKIRTPYEFFIASYRLIGRVPRPGGKALNWLQTMNYRPFNAVSPQGEPDTNADWAGPDAIMKRIDWAHNFTREITTTFDPLAFAQNHIGAALSETTARTIKQAASGQDGLAFLMLSPEFQRR